eukprot:COSAG04_NODE_794_length_10264_cov_35.102804_3_plen_153_part_00
MPTSSGWRHLARHGGRRESVRRHRVLLLLYFSSFGFLPLEGGCCAPLSAAGGGRGGVSQPRFALFSRRFLAHRNRRGAKKRTAKNCAKKTEFVLKTPSFGVRAAKCAVCGQLRGVTLERNGRRRDSWTGKRNKDYETAWGGRIVVDGVEWKE